MSDRHTGPFPAAFTKAPAEVSRTPSYSAEMKTLASMFRYCVEPESKPGDTDKALGRRCREWA